MKANDPGFKQSNETSQTTDSAPKAADHLVRPPSLSLPKGGGAITGIGEKFSMNPVTGTAAFSIPVFTSPGRSDFGPKLTLSYDSGSGNGPFGLGWRLGIPSITRKTSKGLPKYNDDADSDIFLLSDAEDLVPELTEECGEWIHKVSRFHIGDEPFEVRQYRPRIEGPFARIEKWRSLKTCDTHWRVISRDNVTSLYGRSPNARVSDPDQHRNTFQWMLERTWDDKGNAVAYSYRREELPNCPDLISERHRKPAQVNLYPDRILYGNRKPYYVDPATHDIPLSHFASDWLFEVRFDYAREFDPTAGPRQDWSVRQDPFSTYNATFEVRTWRLCHRVLMYHRFDELEVNPYLVRSTDLTYHESPFVTHLASATQTGYLWKDGQYHSKSYPPVEFSYEQLKTLHTEIQEVDRTSLRNLPVGLESGYQFLDLDGEGISGIFSDQGGGWFFKRNLGDVRGSTPPSVRPPTIIEEAPLQFAPVASLPHRPSLGTPGQYQFLDLAGDGQIDVALLDQPSGFYERTPDESWERFRTFESLPTLDFNSPNVRFVDLTGDGLADILITEDQAFVWHESLGEAGFGPGQRIHQALEEDRGPKVVFAEPQQTIFLADMSGDGLNDLVRIRNGEVCYWPNLGYGRFGAKITMENSPWFDHPEQFDPRRIRLNDVDGTGPTDLLYVRPDRVSIWRSASGNGWSAEESITLPPIHSHSSVQVADILGQGTACLVWSSHLPGEAGASLRYIDLIGKRKPHLLRKMENNLGAETVVHYAPSTKFYLADRIAGRPWITRLSFPVHVCEKVETFDRISRNYFATRYAYHHGYFDGVEREFRGFGMVEQWDTETMAALSASDEFPIGDNIDPASHVPPVLTKTWFHTGAYLDRERISNYFAGIGDQPGEYFREPGLSDEEARTQLLEDTILPCDLPPDLWGQACRALKGSVLRQEVYALDGSAKERFPYTVSERNYAVRAIQPRGSSPYAVFHTHERESLSYQYERNPDDPRVAHALTLQVDSFGNVLKSASVGYGRRKPDPALAERDQLVQAKTLVTYTESDVTNPVREPDAYRTPLPAETRTFELTGYERTARSGRFQASDFVLERLGVTAHRFDTEISYEDSPTSGRQRRLIERVRVLYRADGLGEALLPLGKAESRALPGETYKLAFTPGLLKKVFQRTLPGQPTEDLLPDPAAVLALDTPGSPESDRGGYVDLDGDAHWWAPSGRMFLSANRDDIATEELAEAHKHFFLTRRYRDPFGHSSTVTFDDYDLLLLETRDPLDNRVTCGVRSPDGGILSRSHDYRVLQPRLAMDPNRNRSEVAFDILGMVVGTVVMGKPEENLGDSMIGFESNLSDELNLDHLGNPLADPWSILQSATSRLLYDLFAYQRTKSSHNPQPSAVYAMLRETHVADLEPQDQTKIQHAFSYSDGFAREVQRKLLAEPNRAKSSQSGQIRWVGSGTIVYNNKGKPVRQYEPFFSDTQNFEPLGPTGVGPILYYDPIERVVATLLPNATFEKSVAGAWKQTTWDVNDTVCSDPRTDPDIVGFAVSRLQELEKTAEWRTWYSLRINGDLGPREQRAAQKSAPHADTPTVLHVDSLGRPFQSVALIRSSVAEDTTPAATSTLLDIEGNPQQVVDPLGRISTRYCFSLSGQQIHQVNLDSGERWALSDAAGRSIRTWENQEIRFRTSYDSIGRPVGSFLLEAGGPERQIGKTHYGESQAEPESRNLRGRLAQTFDQAGVLCNEAFDFKGNLLGTTRHFASDFKQVLDWSAHQDLEQRAYSITNGYDALNRPTTLTTPDGSVVRNKYNEANLLDGIDVLLRPTKGELSSPTWSTLLKNADYDAKGQRLRVEFGNGAKTNYRYDPLTFRIAGILTSRVNLADEHILQDLSYTHDPVGNITEIVDAAQQPVFFRNRCTMPSALFTYDSIYRLTEAFGREHLGQLSQATQTPSPNDQCWSGSLDQPGDGPSMAHYSEYFLYDLVGNLLSMQHRGADPSYSGWTRTYSYNEKSLCEASKMNNRLSASSVGQTFEHFSYRGHGGARGSMTSMPHLPLMTWDFRGQLRATARQVVLDGAPETTWYVYDADGHRARKVTESCGNAGHPSVKRKERLYLGGFEIYREYTATGQDVNLERETLDIKNGAERLALVETRVCGEDDGPLRATRYQHNNHLGSSVLELDEDARLVSYEEYYAFGGTAFQAVRSQLTPKRYRYAGKERDEESGLYYHGARYYAPWLARWTAWDPLAAKHPGDSAYVAFGNNPLRLLDMDGRQTTAYERYLDRQYATPESASTANAAARSFGSEVMEFLAQPRVQGTLQVIGGLGEMIGSIGLLAAPEPTMLTKVAGGTLLVKGADDFSTGLMTLWSGESQWTATKQAAVALAKEADFSKENAELFGDFVDIGLSLAPTGAMAKAPAATKLIGGELQVLTIADAAESTAKSSTSALQLSAKLTLEEAGLLTTEGKLTTEAITNAEFIQLGSGSIDNPAVVKVLTSDGSLISDWGKYKTKAVSMRQYTSISDDVVTSSFKADEIEIHFYMNKSTGAVDYLTPDFKVKSISKVVEHNKPGVIFIERYLDRPPNSLKGQ